MCPSSRLRGGLGLWFPVYYPESTIVGRAPALTLWERDTPCVPLYIFLQVHIVLNFLPQSFCGWPQPGNHPKRKSPRGGGVPIIKVNSEFCGQPRATVTVVGPWCPKKSKKLQVVGTSACMMVCSRAFGLDQWVQVCLFVWSPESWDIMMLAILLELFLSFFLS